MSHNETYIYILKLEQGKYYIGRTGNPLNRIKKHYYDYGSAWTNKYNPVETLEVIPGCDNFDEDKITKQYMAKYGIDNVRGGSYCQLDLSDEQKSFINIEISNVKDKCYKCGQSGHFINRCPSKDNSKGINNTINISEFDFIEDKEYDNGFVGIVDMYKSIEPEISVPLPLVYQYDSDDSDDYIIDDTESDESYSDDSDYIIDDTESGESDESGESSESDESGESDEQKYKSESYNSEKNIDEFLEEYDELIEQSNDSKNILGILNNNKLLFISYSMDILFLSIPIYYVYRLFIL